MIPNLQKPPRGSHVLAREQKRAEIEKQEEAAKKAAKLRDGLRCRWPESHKCRGLLEGAHIFRDKGMGGDHGTVSETCNLMSLCSWLHRRGPQSIHGKQLRVEAETERGADGPCSFYALDANGEWTCVGVETSIGILRKS